MAVSSLGLLWFVIYILVEVTLWTYVLISLGKCIEVKFLYV